MSRPIFSINTSLEPSRTTSYASSHPYSPTASSPTSDTTDLPFPEPLPRSDFLSPTFNPSTYLSTIVQNRHQTLEDLRSELRTRSQALSQELLELVNSHYADFLGMGASLKGGEDRVQEVWGGLRSFAREVEGIRAGVVERESEVREAVAERRRARAEIERARRMIEWERRIEKLEGRLLIGERGRRDRKKDVVDVEEEEVEEVDSEENEDEEDDANDGTSPELVRLRQRVQEYRIMDFQAEKIGRDHPFVVAQQSRISKCRNAILLDLGNSLRQAEGDSTSRLQIMSLYKDMDASKEAITALKNLHS